MHLRSDCAGPVGLAICAEVCYAEQATTEGDQVKLTTQDMLDDMIEASDRVGTLSRRLLGNHFDTGEGSSYALMRKAEALIDQAVEAMPGGEG